MEDDEHVLNEDFFYEAADVQNKSTPIEEIKYIGISVQPFTDISLILKAPKLEIVTFRICNFETFPQEFFSLPNLKSLDLSGNAIQILPDKESFSLLPNLRSLNLQDNGISELSEVFKISGAPNIRQLSLSGNVCISQNDSFNLITKEFKKLVVLNDLIITSQHRGFIDNMAVFDSNSCLPSSKTDDFFFLYVKYMHASNNERYVRRSNAEYFCINRVIRRYSAAEKIQSVFRGFMSRMRYTKILHSALNLQSFLKLWYFKRLTAVNRIRSCFLHFRMRQIIKQVRSIRTIQSSWRRKKSREYTAVEVFFYNGSYSIIIPQNNLEKIKNFLKANKLEEPKSIVETPYKLIRTKEAKKVPFPGSPIIYYSCDDSLVARICHNNNIPKNSTIWCSHDHSAMKGRKKVTQYGINYTRQCPFASIPMIKIIVPKKSLKLKKYDTFVKLNYYDREKFAKVIYSILKSDINLTLYPERNLVITAAKITIQSSFRTFIERLKNFRDIKQQAIEKRALSCIRYSLKTQIIHRCVSHISNTIKYYNSLPRSTTFYIPYQYYSSLISMKKKYDVDFGFASDKSLILEKNSPDGFLKKIIPTGRIVFALSDLPSIVNVGVISSKVQSSSFSIPIPMKYVKRYKIMRLTYITPEEAKRRLTLFAWMTNKFDIIMTEREVLEFCCANVIHSCWRGYSYRRRLVHILIQMGSLFDHSKLFKRMNFKGRNQYYFRKLSMLGDSNSKDKGQILQEPLSSDPIESIHELRHDYRPWERQLKDFRETIHNENKYKTIQPDQIPKNFEKNDRDNDDVENSKEISPSALNIGLKTANDLPEIKTIKIPSKSALNYNRNYNIIGVDTNKGRHSNIENPKLNNNLLYQKTQNIDNKKNFNQNESSSTKTEKNPTISSDKDQAKGTHSDEKDFKIIEVEEKNEDEDDFNNDFDFLKNKKQLSNKFNLSSSNAKKDKFKFLQSHSQLTLPVNYNAILKDENNKYNLRSNRTNNNDKSQSRIIDDPLLSSLDNELDENPRLMAPFFTGSPKRKVRDSKDDESDDSDNNNYNNNHKFLSQNRFKSSKSAFSLYDTSFDIQFFIKEDKPQEDQINDQVSDEMPPLKSTHSSQRTKNIIQELVKIAFSKLSRLHHLGLIIVSSAAVDNSIEKNRQIAIEAREDLEKKRTENDMKKNTLSNETHQRAQIEHSLLLEQIQDQREMAKKERTKRVKEIKDEQKSKRDKYIQSQSFGQNFVNMARVISHKAEMSKKGFFMKNSPIFTKSSSVLSNSLSCGNRKQQMVQRKVVSSLRQSNIETKNALKEFNDELEKQRRRLTLLDKMLLEKKRKKNLDSKTERLNALYEEKRKDKERRKLMKTQKDKNSAYIPPVPVTQVQEDETESAARNIGSYMGANLGIIESHLLIDIISSIIQ